MQDNNHREALRKEREKLELLVGEALKKSTPITKTRAAANQCKKISRLTGIEGNRALQDEEIQKQSRKIDSMIIRAEREGG